MILLFKVLEYRFLYRGCVCSKVVWSFGDVFVCRIFGLLNDGGGLYVFLN